MQWVQGWGFQALTPTGDINDALLIKNPDGSVSVAPGRALGQGWGFKYLSLSGDVNDAQILIYDDGSMKGPDGSFIAPPGTKLTASAPAAAAPGASTPAPTPADPNKPDPAATPTPSVATTSDADKSAKGLINSTLATYGLSSLAEWAWGKWTAGESIDQIMLELRDTPEYNARFPAMKQLSQQGHALSEAQYIAYEESAAQAMKAAGLPAGFYDSPADYAGFLTNNVSISELTQRLNDYQTIAFSSPQAVRDELQTLYGVTPGELTAFFIDPTKAEPLIHQRFAAAQAAGYSDVTGFGKLNVSQAETVGNLGLSEGQLSQGFGQLASENEWWTPLVGNQGEQAISKDVAIGAQFENNAADQSIINQRKGSRISPFAGGGGVAQNQRGAVGAGKASSG